MNEWACGVTKAEDEYLPSGPLMSPLTSSSFWTWALYDLRIGKSSDTMASCQMAACNPLGGAAAKNRLTHLTRCPRRHRGRNSFKSATEFLGRYCGNVTCMNHSMEGWHPINKTLYIVSDNSHTYNMLTGEPMDRRVFISSVMDGFAKQRDAAKAAVELLRLRPVMAEDFGAKSHSPQQACFDGIRESDAVVLVLGRRYGFIAQSGKSVTEEEFDFARKRGIPVLIFVEKVAREPEQEAFVRRLSSYEEGYHRVTFATPEELKDEIVKALNDEFHAGAHPALSTAGAKDALDRMKWGGTRDRHRGPWLGAVILPARQQQCVSVLKLGEKSFHRAVQKEAVYGKADIFSSEHGVNVQEAEDNTAFVQLDDRGQKASLEVRVGGALTYRKLLGNASASEYSIVRSFVIDREEVKASLANFFRFAHEFYNLLDESRMLTSFFFGGSLSGIEHKSFGRIPAIPSSGMSIASHSLPDPLSIPREPYALSRVALVDGEKPADEIVELAARIFRSSRAYYAAGEGRS